jgi:hypothetical protein
LGASHARRLPSPRPRPSKSDLLDHGLDLTKSLRCAIMRVIPNLVRGNRMRSGAHHRWVELGEDLTDGERRLFAQPLALAELGRFIIRVYRDSASLWRKWRNRADEVQAKPLYLSLRHKGADNGAWVTVMGLPVVRHEGEEPSAHFKANFQRAAEACHANYT